ncbi:hypothetical protein GGR56DRAFT_666704 [Xylariaceae sp. FL0804]|nr:hypothetical protein GGR56DRAFT_666704 [Xylariaceae sp. FL0804]
MASDTEPGAGDNTRMRAWQYTSTAGGLEKGLKLNEAARRPGGRSLGAREILVRVHNVSLNPADWKLAEMLSPLNGVARPRAATPGMDFAGVIEQMGSGVAAAAAAAAGGGSSWHRVGARCFGRAPAPFAGRGALATYVVVGPDDCAELPDAVGFEDGACVGTAGLAAWQSIAPHVTAGAGDRVFVNGGSGGTGTFGIQVARALGCRVAASCSAGGAAELCRALGAERVVDYAREDAGRVLSAEGRVFRVVMDNALYPVDLYRAADAYLLPDGRYVSVGGPHTAHAMASTLKRLLVPSFLGGGKRKLVILTSACRPDHLAAMARLMEEGKVKPVIDEVFAFDEVPRAFEKLKTGHAHGKIVIKV